METTITLDSQSFKALSSKTRIDVMKLLAQRRHTQSEIASSLGLSIPSVKDHLDALVHASLAERNEDGHKWVYYSLSKKGKHLLSPERTNIIIALSVLALSFVGGVLSFMRSTALLSARSFEMAKDSVPVSAPSSVTEPLLAGASPTALSNLSSPQIAPDNHVLFWIIVAIEIAILIYLLIKRRRAKRLLGLHS